ncbi:hypothetical protein BDV96DRAFT_602133 [Lophiotrema nucula]|uniref:WD40-repeat-containing domain protein n=1 Tax=Lophiotrema nucula TaxID=690887 RepID=A0A6A5Z152_9PLEO|nr:hypothetical protein BDV96DRAFT_602133 [Lophiotrema nucula]
MSAVPGPSSPTHRRSSSVAACFRTFPASLTAGSPSAKQLEKFSSKPAISTTISSSGWIAISTPADVRLYRMGDEDRKGNIKRYAKVTLRSNQGKKIRATALSDDLLAIITDSHLLVYEYRDPDGLGSPMEKQIDQGGRWRPKAVKIFQKGSVGRRSEAYAWIAVGGQGQNGVNLFKCTYSPYSNCWSSQADRVILPCPGNTGFVRIVGFSPSRFNRDDIFMVLGVTESNWMHCWTVREQSSGAGMESHCDFDISCGTVAPSNSGSVTSAELFLCPLGNPYVFCSVNRKPGCTLLPTFLIPIGTSHFDWSTTFQDECILPEFTSGQVLGGTVTPNGHFIVAIEGSEVVLLTLQTAVDGGLTCLRDHLRWNCALRLGPSGGAALSISIKESFGRLDIVAVDGQGSVMSAQLSVANMPPTQLPHRVPVPQTPEMPGNGAIFQLSSGESTEGSRYSASSTS